MPRSRAAVDASVVLFQPLEARLLLDGQGTLLDVNAVLDAGQGTLSAATWDIGQPRDLFDGNTESLYRSAAVDPAWVRLDLDQPRMLLEFDVWVSHTWGDPAYNWMIETAETPEDMDAQSGTYAVAVDWTGTPSDAWSTVTLAEPVAARSVRLSVERLTGDDYVHINEWQLHTTPATVVSLSVAPDSATLMQYDTLDLTATATDSTGLQFDCTDTVTWLSSDPAVATVEGGHVVALGAGSCLITAMFDPTLSAQCALEVLPNPDARADLNVTHIERTPRYDYDAAKNTPAPGDTVTFIGHVRNWDAPTAQAEYRWMLDGATVERGMLENLAPGEERLLELPWTWQDSPHTIALVVDSANTVPEVSELNNMVADRTDALAVGFWVEQTVYSYFQQHQHDLGIGSNSWEDWAQRQMARWNEHCVNAIHPDSPEGVLDRVRIDKIVIVPDNALPLHGGYAGNHPDLSDRTVDLMWGFPVATVSGGMYSDHTGLWEGNAFYLEPSLIHEMGHARYLIDNYGYDVANNADVTQVCIIEDGQPVAGTSLMPFLAWESVLYYNQFGGIMSGPWRSWSPYEAACHNLIAGNRASQGNYNAPGNIGVFLNDLPEANHVRFVDASGAPLAGADVQLYRAVGSSGWYGKSIDNTADLQFTTDADGYAHMPTNPFADGPIQHTYGIANGIAVLRIEHEGTVWFRFLEVAAFNMEHWRGNTEDGYYSFELPAPGSPPEIQVEGFGQTIADADTTPDLADHTSFGAVALTGASVTRQYVIRKRGGSDLHLSWPRVQISGPDAGDFALLSEPYELLTPQRLTSFQIRFDPSAPGPHQAIVTIASDDADEGSYSFAIEGVGGSVRALTLGDANDDGMVDVGDLGILGANYRQTGLTGNTWALADFTGDGTVDVGDLGILGDNYGFIMPLVAQQTSPPPAQADMPGPSAPAPDAAALPGETRQDDTAPAWPTLDQPAPAPIAANGPRAPSGAPAPLAMATPAEWPAALSSPRAVAALSSGRRLRADLGALLDTLAFAAPLAGL